MLKTQTDDDLRTEQFSVGDRVRRKPRPDVRPGFTLAGTVVKTHGHAGRDGVHVVVNFDTFARPTTRVLSCRLVPASHLERDQ